MDETGLNSEYLPELGEVEKELAVKLSEKT